LKNQDVWGIVDRNELKSLVETLPDDRVVIAKSFLLWLSAPETLTNDEWQEVLKGNEAYQKGDYVKWRATARTI
jgi:hypothetical protein